MKYQNLFKSSIFIFSLLFILSCGSDPITGGFCSNSDNWTAEVDDESNAFNNAITAYNQNMNTENCNALVQAYLDYINALEPWGECLLGTNSHQSWQQLVDNLEVEAMNIQC